MNNKMIYKKGKYLFFAVLFLVVAALAFSSCDTSGQNDQSTDDSDNMSQGIVNGEDIVITKDVQIIYGEEAQKSVNKLRTSIRSIIGKTPNASLTGAETGSCLDILVGKTGRSESEDLINSLGENDYGIKIYKSGSKVSIVIVSKEDANIGYAVEMFIREYLSKEKSQAKLLKTESTLGIVKKEENKVFEFEGLVFEEQITVSSAPIPYSRICVLNDGRYLCVWPISSNDKKAMMGVFSSDKGETWTSPREMFCGVDDNTLENVDILQTDDGTVYITYRSLSSVIKSDGPFYSSIKVFSSTDNCNTFSFHSTVVETTWEDGREPAVAGKDVGYWEPNLAMIEGELVCFFAISKDTTVNGPIIIPSTDIFVLQDDNKTWKRHEYTSDDTYTTKRNGMPIVRQLSTGGYLMSVETQRFMSETGSGLLPFLLYSEDGKHWKGICGTFFPEKGATGGAPYWIELPDGRILVAFQTDEDIKGTSMWKNDDLLRKTKIVISKKGVAVKDLTPEDFSESYDLFDTPLGYCSLWPGMFIDGDYLYIYVGTNYPNNSIIMKRAKISELG